MEIAHHVIALLRLRPVRSLCRFLPTQWHSAPRKNRSPHQHNRPFSVHHYASREACILIFSCPKFAHFFCELTRRSLRLNSSDNRFKSEVLFSRPPTP